MLDTTFRITFYPLLIATGWLFSFAKNRFTGEEVISTSAETTYFLYDTHSEITYAAVSHSRLKTENRTESRTAEPVNFNARVL